MNSVQKLIASSRLKRHEAEFILQALTGKERPALYSDTEITDEIRDEFKKLAKLRRDTHSPLQYLVGKAYFYGNEYRVIAGVFIPRPETESLVEAVLEYIDGSKKTLKILDLGSGVGNISLSLATEREGLQIDAIEINSLAWQTASRNKKIFEEKGLMKSDVKFILGDMLQVGELNKKYDIVISNPPYLPFSVRDELPADVLLQEPPSALFASEDGLFFYRKIMEMCKSGLLKKRGALFFEIPEDKADELESLAKKTGFSDILVSNDLVGRNRVMRLKISE